MDEGIDGSPGSMGQCPGPSDPRWRGNLHRKVLREDSWKHKCLVGGEGGEVGRTHRNEMDSIAWLDGDVSILQACSPPRTSLGGRVSA